MMALWEALDFAPPPGPVGDGEILVLVFIALLLGFFLT